MEQVRKLTRQAYSQAPWRSQTQWIGSFLLVVVVTALVAFIYLNTTAQAATYGRQIQEMQVKDIYYPSTAIDSQQSLTLEDPTFAQNEELSIEELLIQISDLKAQIAESTSLARVEAYAEEMNMRPNDPEKTIYLGVPGYTGRQEARLAPPPHLERSVAPGVPAIYKQSLIDWLKLQIVQTSRLLIHEVQP